MKEETEKIEPYYQIRAKEIVDILYDGKCFAEKMTRDDFNGVEDLIAYNFQQYAKSARKMSDIMIRIKK